MYFRKWVPNIVTLVLAVLLVITQQVWAGPLVKRLTQAASPSSKSTINYQGYLTEAGGTPVNDTLDMVFRLYNVESDGDALWAENHNDVPVAGGLFSVLLGGSASEPNPIPQSLFAENDSLWLGISVGGDQEMAPREQLASAPSAMTVSDESITTTKLADGAVTTAKLNVDDSLTTNGNLMVNGEEIDQFPDIWEKWSLMGVKPMREDGYAGHNLSGGFGTTVQWDSDYAFFGVRDRGANRKDSVVMWGDDGEDKLLFLFGHAGSADPREVMSLDPNGNLRARGTKSALVEAGQFGQRRLYAAESPEVRFFDEGLARLKDGVARVVLDPVFLETIEGDYLVHVTPYGKAHLYVAEIGKDYFVVKALDGDTDVAFAWRLSAHRKGYAGVRLEAAD